MGTFSCSITADWPDSLDDARIDTAHRIGPELEDGRPDGVLEVGAGLVVDDLSMTCLVGCRFALTGCLDDLRMAFRRPSDDLRMSFG